MSDELMDELAWMDAPDPAFDDRDDLTSEQKIMFDLTAERDAALSELTALRGYLDEQLRTAMSALGISDHARPVPPREVWLNEVLPALTALRERVREVVDVLAEVTDDVDDSFLLGQLRALGSELSAALAGEADDDQEESRNG